MVSEPKTLQEAIVYFSDPVNCREYVVARRWPNGVTCPRCGGSDVLFLENYNRWECRGKHDARQFTLKTGTVMEDSPISVSKWLRAMWQIVNCKNGISSYEVHRAIGITQKSAWFMDHRIRLAFHSSAQRISARRKDQGQVLLRRLFREHADRWKNETGHLSSIQKITAHPSYLRIIGFGQDALPLILKELKERPDHWLVALNAITGEDPAPDRATFREAVAAWIKWGENRGFR